MKVNFKKWDARFRCRNGTLVSQTRRSNVKSVKPSEYICLLYRLDINLTNIFRIRDKINNPPKDINQQEVSKRFKSFIKLKESAKADGKGKQRKLQAVNLKNTLIRDFLEMKSVNDDFKSTKIDLEGIRKNANETDYKFLKRVNRITHQRRVEAGFAAKYHVDIVRDQDTGEIKLKKKPKDEISELMKKRRAEAKSGKKKFREKEIVKEEPVKLTSLQKLKLKKLSKKNSRKEEKALAFEEYQHEEIAFGETVLAPPSLVKPRKAAKAETVSRPGQRELLLSSMLKSGAPAVVKPSTIFTATKPTMKVIKGPIDKKGKRKNLPNSTRMALESAQQNAVDLYRQLKKKQPIVPIPNKNLEDF